MLGKPIGITIASYLASFALKQRLPGNSMQMVGMALLAGIGFTMSLFIGNLAFGAGDLATPVRFGVLGGSLISAVFGLIVLWWACRKLSPAAHSTLGTEEDIAEARGVLENIDPPKRPK